jgi:hypothetical protein
MMFAITLLYIFLSYVYPGEIFPALAPYRIPLFVGIVGMAFSLIRAWVTGRLRVGGAQVLMLAGFTVTMMVSLILADHWFGGAFEVVQDFGVAITMFLLVIWNVDTLKKAKVVIVMMIVLSVGLAVQGIAAFHFGYKADQLIMTQDVDDDNPGDDAPQLARIRGFGVFNDPNDLALGLVSVSPLLVLTWQRKRRLRNLALVVLPAAVVAYGVFLTHSRGAIVSILAVILFGCMPRLGRVKTLILMLVLAGLMMAVNLSGGRAVASEDDSAAGRVDSWSEGLQMLKEQPLFGVGYHNYTEHNRLTAHNSFVLCFAELGLVGYFFWLGMIVTTFMQILAVRRIKQEGLDPALGMWASGLRVALIAFFAGAFFLSRTYVPLLYLLLGLAVAMVELVKEEGFAVELPHFGRWLRIVSSFEFGSLAFIYSFVRVNGLFVK